MQKGDWPPAHYPDTPMTQEGMKGWRDGSALTALERSGFSSQEPASSGLHRLLHTYGAHKSIQAPMYTRKEKPSLLGKERNTSNTQNRKRKKKATNPSPTTTEMKSRGTVASLSLAGRICRALPLVPATHTLHKRPCRLSGSNREISSDGRTQLFLMLLFTTLHCSCRKLFKFPSTCYLCTPRSDRVAFSFGRVAILLITSSHFWLRFI